jgi:PAS domain S-box-containing protein
LPNAPSQPLLVSDDKSAARSELAIEPSTLAEAVREIVCICDVAGALQYANRAWFEFTGRARAEQIQTGWAAAVDPADAENLMRRFAERRGTGMPEFELELRLRRYDGTYRTMCARACAASDGAERRAAWVVTLVDVDDRKKAERQRDSLKLLVDAGAVGFVLGDRSGGISDANDKFLRMIGYEREDVVDGKLTWSEITPPEWTAADQRAIEEFMRTGIIEPYEKEYFRKDGSRVPVMVGVAGMTVDGAVCYVSDLTALKRSERAQRVSDSRLRRLFDANVVGILIANNAGSIIEANDAFLEMIGYTREDLERGLVDWRNLTPPEYLPRDELAIAEMAQHGTFAQFEKEYVRKDGTRLPISAGGARLEGTADEQICYIVDLSPQRDAMLKIQESEQRYRTLAEALPGIVMLTDEARRPIYINRHYEEYTGLGMANLPERWLDVIHPDDLPGIRRARATGESYEVEYRLRRASDGAYRWHFARTLKLPGDLPGPRWVAVAMDIDDRKRAEEALQFIEKASTLLSKSLDLATTFETLLDLVVPAFGDWAAISLRDEDGIVRTVVARHKDPLKAPFAHAICGVDYFSGTQALGTAAVYRTGEPQLHSQFDLEDLKAAVKEQYVPIFEAMGIGSLIALPILRDDEVIGSFGIVSAGAERTYGPADLPPLEELARRAGFAIENARRYEREHRVASILQEAALPRTLPNVAGLVFDGYYKAGRQEAVIGGDWFDALVVSGGRIVISVGDVAGNGLQAAVLMGNMRQVIRAAANVHADPTMIFEVADRTLRGENEDRMVTAFIGVIDPVASTMVYASAGHLPALLRGADGEISELTARGLPLGYRSAGASESKTVRLQPGSCLLLYTDGLIEWSRDIFAGEELLRQRFATVRVDDAHPAKALVESILPAAGARDDVAVLTVSIRF